ncbi:MAG: hypothetical protein QY325_08710 [Flavobacteriales bacterium]|nr:MAG: hypothetical protein QY325_08710 [Flavobacteriales bacterium]
MLDQIIPQLKAKLQGELTGKLGVDPSKVDGIVNAAGDSVKEGMGQGLDLSAALNLFSKDANDAHGSALLGSMGESFLGKLTGPLGFDAAKAGSIKDLVMPVLTQLVTEKVGGNKNLLSGLLGGGGKDLLSGAAGKLGGLGKLFGKD